MLDRQTTFRHPCKTPVCGKVTPRLLVHINMDARLHKLCHSRVLARTPNSDLQLLSRGVTIPMRIKHLYMPQRVACRCCLVLHADIAQLHKDTWLFAYIVFTHSVNHYRVNFAARCWFALGALVNMDEASPDSPKGLLACISLSWSGRTGHNDIQLNGHQSGAVALEWPSCNACLSVDHINMQSKARILEL